MHKYRTLLQYALRQRRYFAWIFLLTLTASALVALQPWPMKVLVDHVLLKHPLPPFVREMFAAIFLNPTPTVLLLLVTLGGLTLFAVNSVLDMALTWSWTVAGRRMVYDLSEDLFARLQLRSLLFHSRHPVGDTLSRITGDSWCVYHVVDALFFAPMHAVLSMLGMVLLMGMLDSSLTLLSLIIAPFLVGASLLVGKPLRAAAKLKREIESRIQSHIQQTLTGIPVVQSFVQEGREQRRFQGFADAAIRAQQRSTLIGSLNSLTSGLIATLGTGLILWVSARHYMDGKLTIGGIMLFLVYLNSLQAQLKVLAGIYTALQGFSASVDRVMEILRTEPEVRDRPGAEPLRAARGHVQVEGVTFGYETGRPVLHNVSLDLAPGHTLAIVGATGTGKSTLVSLVPRFHDPWEGRVLIDGQDARDVQLKSLRDHVAVVLQEPFLFPDSISENIAYGRPTASRAEIEAAARRANAHEFIERLPKGYDTVLGERGATLSGGERQRISIARALLKDAPILILDEPTSALDAVTERTLLEALERLMRDRTTFIIAHRLSTVRRADRIVLLSDGRIVESGTHDELLAQRGLYARYYDLQFSRKKDIAAAAP